MSPDRLDLDKLLASPWGGPNWAIEARPHQRQALEAILTAVVTGHRRIRAIMAAGTGAITVATECVRRLQANGGARRVLCVVDRRAIAEQIRHRFNSCDVDASVLGGSALVPPSRVQIATFAYFTSQSGEHLTATKPGLYDLLIIPHLRDNVAMRRILGWVQPELAIGFSRASAVSTPAEFEAPVYMYELREALSDSLSELPVGYRALTLGDIAEIRLGQKARVATGEKLSEVPIIRAADIARQWEFPTELSSSTEVPESSLDEQPWVRPGDILIPAVQSIGSMHVGVLVPDDPPPAIPASTVIVVRIVAPDVIPQTVLDFFESSLGRRVLAMTASRLGTDVHVADLGQVVVHVPVPDGDDEPAVNLDVARIRAQLREHVLPRLESLVDPAFDDDQREYERREIAEVLRDIAGSLARRSLSERVVETFPTPIAMAWRRYHDARFNPFEQVLRLRDLFEAAAFFTYNVMLLDALRRLEPASYTLTNKVRGAWRGASMAKRLEFVETVLNHDGVSTDLFLPELASSDVAALGRRLQSEFRNKISHSGAASESYQLGLISEFYPVVRQMLEELSFLEHYRLARIPTISFRDGCPVQRMELWRGTVPEIVEHQLDADAELPRIDSEHLVLLNMDNECLDLHPLYQLINNDETGLQPQIFFVKQGNPGRDVFTIGSTYDATELEVSGGASLKQLEDEFFSQP